MRINNNVMALNAHRQLAVNQTNASKSMERLSSGMRINRAGDDAAGLAISEKMRGQIRGLKQAQRNAQDGISLIQTAEGALNETHAILQRMRELGVQASTETLSDDDRNAIISEITTLKAEIDNIAASTNFNTKKLLNGGLSAELETIGEDLGVNAGISSIEINGASVNDATGTQAANYQVTYNNTAKTMTVTKWNNDGSKVEASETLSVDMSAATAYETKILDFSSVGVKITVNNQLKADIGTVGTYDAKQAFTLKGGDMKISIGANGEEITFNIGKMDTDALGITGSVDTYLNAKDFVKQVQDAIVSVSEERSSLGAVQNRLEHTITNLGTSAENLQAAESRIRDLDMAEEMMAFTKNNILQQAATAMLAQANMAPQSVLQLLG